ncbi:MAG: type II toxin-antitoxin system death-on-curing family toxin [Candidatus Lokiarchaeota archaeon]|nr:type II toxin-antitoxin system death-on-curing family toxin [Candidatus Lokiarchaeota archaeon]
MWFPSVEYILALFNDQISLGTLMNRNGLISTLDKLKWGIPFHDAPTIWEQAAILYKEIVENHYFSDGNKRIGILIIYIFLFKNGYVFNPNVGEIYNITMDVAQGLKSFEELVEWFKKKSKRIE